MVHLAAALLLVTPQTTQAKSTTLSFEIVTTRGSSARLASQDWGRVFAKLGHIVTIRQQATANATIPDQAVTQTETRLSRRIKAVGLLDSRGRVHFGSKVFRASDEANLKAWIDGLKKYGVQGSPSGKPLWGLTAKQFDQAFIPLAKTMPTEVAGMTIQDAILAMEVDRRLTVNWDTGTKEIAAKAGIVTRNLNKFGKGTALAIMLNDAGLGFLPERQGDGTVTLLVVKKGQRALWPIGWPPKVSLSRTMPHFYKKTDVSLPKVSLTRVFSAVEKQTKVPILVDYPTLKAKGLDFEKMQADVRPRRMSWNSVIRTVSIQNRMNYDARVDEQGSPFVWVSSNDVIKAWDKRFALSDK